MEKPLPARIVKPRKPYTNQLPLLVVTREWIYSEERGNYPGEDLHLVIGSHPSAIVACADPASMVGDLHYTYQHDPKWQFRVTPLQRERINDKGEIDCHTEMIVNFFGFQRANGKRDNRYFYPISPVQFCRATLHDLIPGGLPYEAKLYQWARNVLDFCAEYDLKPSPTAGGIAAQLLRHPMFYPEPRRKVPKATNERARDRLPGNYYELRAEEGKTYQAAVCIDQESAHHSAAETVPMPHADELYARGRFRNADNPGIWLNADESADFLKDHHGLIHARVEVSAAAAQLPFLLPEVSRAGERSAYLYTNEVTELAALGIRILGIHSAWTSTKIDTGIRNYAIWAKDLVRQRPADKKWLKPTLLATYGILAAKPRVLEFGYWQAKTEDRQPVILGAERLDLALTKTKKKMQAPIANVIQRGMVEAETRRRSLELARELTAQRYEVLCVYADGVIIRDPSADRRHLPKPKKKDAMPYQLPLLDPPWRIKERLTWLQFINPQSYISRESVKLPGTRRENLLQSKASDHSQPQEVSHNGNVRQRATAKER